jgi:hypothetical protein
MYNIRLYKESDKEEIERWLKYHNAIIDIDNCFPKNSTFVCEIDGKLALVGTMHLTICKNYSFIENAYGNPDLKGPERKLAMKEFMIASENLAKDLGYKNLVFWTDEPKLINKYKDLGYKEFRKNVSLFMKTL